MAIRLGSRIESDSIDTANGLPDLHSGIDRGSGQAPKRYTSRRSHIPIEETPGIMRLDNLGGSNGGDVVFAFVGEAYLRNLAYLTEKYADFAQRNIGWSASYAHEMAESGLNVRRLTGTAPLNDGTINLILEDPIKRKLIPTVILFRPVGSLPEQYTGMSAHRMFFPVANVKGQEQQEAVLYHILRAFDEEQRGQKRGRTTIQLARFLHHEANPRKYNHRTGSAIAAYANTQSPEFDQTTSHPWAEPFIEGSLDWAIEQRMSQILGNPSIDLHGVARRFYREPNQAVVVRGNHLGVKRIADRMSGEFGMDPLDAIMPMYTFRFKR